MIGTITHYPVLPPPAGWLECGGQAISRTKYVELFQVLGTRYGTGNGTTTFNLPDCRGRVLAGPNTMGGASALRLTNPVTNGVDGDAIGNVGGVQVAELPINALPAGTPNDLTTTDVASGSGTTVVTGSINNGDGDAHNNVQPTIIIPVIIFSGVYDGDSIGT